MGLDGFETAGIILIFFPAIAYIAVLIKQFNKLKTETEVVQILSTRVAMFLPAYSILMFISLMKPSAYLYCEVGVSVFEGLSFYGFFSMMVQYLGGPEKVFFFIYFTYLLTI